MVPHTWRRSRALCRKHGGFRRACGIINAPSCAWSQSVVAFYGVFIPAFVAHTVVWCSFWFLLRFGAGEWLGSLAGSFAFVAVIGWRFGNLRPIPTVSVAFFVAHSLGYFAGGKLMGFLTSPTEAELFNSLTRAELGTVAKLSWGLLYGLGFGAGLGYTFHVFQKSGLIPLVGNTSENMTARR